MRALVAMLAIVGVACGKGADDRKQAAPEPAKPEPTRPPEPAKPPEGEVKNVVPNDLFAAGAPTLVIGTLGDDRTDRMIAAQAEFMRGLLNATVVLDTSIDLAKGPSAWPARPLLYGGRHVNAVVAALGDALPLNVDADRITVGGQTFEGLGYRVITVVPATDQYPAFGLYAGTGTPGTTEINGIRHGGEPILIGDGFGRLTTGTWTRGADGKVTATLAAPARRIAWRMVERGDVRVAFPEMLAAAADDDAVADACARGIAAAATRLGVTAPPITVYVYPDPKSKQGLTGDPGHGHAIAAARAVHVLRIDGARIEPLIVHESTHVITGELWGPAASLLLGEGIAVWVSGGYQGKPLAQWQPLKLGESAQTILGVAAFRQHPEADTYPYAGSLVDVLIAQIGIEKLRDIVYRAVPDTWAALLEEAGTTPEAVDQAMPRAR